MVLWYQCGLGASEIDCTIPLTNKRRSVCQDAAGRITSDQGLQKRDRGSGSGEGWSAMMLENMIRGGFGVKFSLSYSGTYPKPHCRSVSSQEHPEFTLSDCMTSFDFPARRRVS